MDFKRQKIEQIEWNEQKKIVYFLENSNMFFVNREYVIQKHQNIYMRKLARAAANGRGEHWIGQDRI